MTDIKTIKKLLRGINYLVITEINDDTEITIEYRKVGFTPRDQYEMSKAIEEHLRLNGLQTRINSKFTTVYITK